MYVIVNISRMEMSQRIHQFLALKFAENYDLKKKGIKTLFWSKKVDGLRPTKRHFEF